MAEPFLHFLARNFIDAPDLGDYCFVFPNRRSGKFFEKESVHNTPFLNYSLTLRAEKSKTTDRTEQIFLIRSYFRNTKCVLRNHTANKATYAQPPKRQATKKGFQHLFRHPNISIPTDKHLPQGFFCTLSPISKSLFGQAVECLHII